jgi:hypothetical protein
MVPGLHAIRVGIGWLQAALRYASVVGIGHWAQHNKIWIVSTKATPGCQICFDWNNVRPESGGRYVCELLASLPDSSA